MMALRRSGVIGVCDARTQERLKLHRMGASRVDYHLRPRRDDLEEARERVVREPDAAVRDRVADRPRLVRAVDRGRSALRPPGEDRRERRDPERTWSVWAARVGRDEALVHVVAPDR